MAYNSADPDQTAPTAALWSQDLHSVYTVLYSIKYFVE